jgi:hypothetical protein
MMILFMKNMVTTEKLFFYFKGFKIKKWYLVLFMNQLVHKQNNHFDWKLMSDQHIAQDRRSTLK